MKFSMDTFIIRKRKNELVQQSEESESPITVCDNPSKPVHPRANEAASVSTVGSHPPSISSSFDLHDTNPVAPPMKIFKTMTYDVGEFIKGDASVIDKTNILSNKWIPNSIHFHWPKSTKKRWWSNQNTTFDAVTY